MAATPSAPPLRPLRADLVLHRGDADAHGAPVWTLHDPAANRFYRLSWPAYELLSRWPLGSLQAMVDAVCRETTLQVTLDDAQALHSLLDHGHLLQSSGPAGTRRLVAEATAAKLGPARWLLHHYLSLRVPLVRPGPFLDRTAPCLAWAWHPAFWALVGCTALLGWLLALRRWDEFSHGVASLAAPSGLLAVAAAVLASKLLHELGHAFTAHRHGCRVPTMGVAFLVLWPVFYTDTNEAWKLPARRHRLTIAVAGMATELALASFALLAWTLLPDTPAWAPARSAALVLATTTWVLTLAINASPFMRFDGYFVLSDLLNLPNLHERSFAHGRWWLREALFGWGDAPPEPGSATRRRLLVLFAFATWAYRLVLYIGIALLVYHFAFKALGLLLMVVELAWFVAGPVARELQHWWSRRAAIRPNFATVRTAAGAVALVAALVLPWDTRLHAPAVIGPSTVQAVYAPETARLERPLPAAGQRVKAGEVLVQLASPELQYKLQLAQARQAQLRWQLTQQGFDERLLQAGAALRKRWEGANTEVAGLQREIQRLRLVAPFDGLVAEVADDAPAGAWVTPADKLLVLVGPGGRQVEAYVDEAGLQALQQVAEGAPRGLAARYLGGDARQPAVHCRGFSADAVQLARLEQPLLAQPHGGQIEVQILADGRLLPRRPTFRVLLTDCDEGDATPRQHAGTAVFNQPAQAWSDRAWRGLVAAWHSTSLLN
jgi:putative peptide zinc metalloprotease protein